MPDLAEIVARLDEFNADNTIYVQRPWSAQSAAVVAAEREDGSPPVDADGLDYFLEVNLAREAAGLAPGRELEAIVYYAEHDAFLDL